MSSASAPPGSLAREAARRPGPMTDLGPHAAGLAGVPADPATVAGVVQGLLLHAHMAPAYGVDLTEERRQTMHLHASVELLDAALRADPRPLTEPRPLDRKVVGVCRHFSVLAAAILKARGVPARVRCGFATYFLPGFHEDHWVVETWREEDGRWALLDPQLDARHREVLPIDFDPADVPRDRFLVAGEAWIRCRDGATDPASFGFSGADAGLGFVAGNLLRDAAALNDAETNPWDCWGLMPDDVGAPIPADDLELLDRLAALTRDPDSGFAELRQRYASDERVRVPATVLNALSGQIEPSGI